MFNLGLSEIVLISVIALIFIGPKQLPEIAKALGRALNELKRASEDLTSSITNPKHYSKEDSPAPISIPQPIAVEEIHDVNHLVHDATMHEPIVEAVEPIEVVESLEAVEPIGSIPIVKKDEGSST